MNKIHFPDIPQACIKIFIPLQKDILHALNLFSDDRDKALQRHNLLLSIVVAVVSGGSLRPKKV